MSYLIFIMANWGAILCGLLVITALGFASYLLKNLWYALAAVVILAVMFGWQYAFTSGVREEAARQIARERAVFEQRIAAVNKVNEAYQSKVLSDAKVIEDLEKKANETPPNTGVCFDLDTTRRVRAIE